MNKINLLKNIFISIIFISVSLTGLSAVEAEDALVKVLNDEGKYDITTQMISNANNGKFVSLYNKGDHARFKVSVKHKGFYSIKLRVRSGAARYQGVEDASNNKTVYIHNDAYTINVNSKYYAFNGDDNSISVLKGWVYWGTMSSRTKIYLNAGENFIDIKANHNWLAVDSILLKNLESTPVNPIQSIPIKSTSLFEAEDDFSIVSESGNNSPIKAYDMLSASNKNYVSILDRGDKMGLNFNISKNGSYTLRLRVRAGWIVSSKYYVTLDGSKVLQTNTFDKKSNSGYGEYIWSDLVYENISLSAGSHTLQVLAKGTWQMVDALKVNMIKEESDIPEIPSREEPSYEELNHEVTIMGSNKKYNSISKAIDSASSGDKIIVGSGVYNESLVINKNISIIGKKGATLSGEQKVENWQYDNSKNLYYAPSPCGRVDFLFANGVKQKPAFFPENGYIGGHTKNSKDFYLDNKSYKRVDVFKKNTNHITMPNDLAGTLAIMHFRPWERSASYVGSTNGNSISMENSSIFEGSDFSGLSFAYVVSSIKNVGQWGIRSNNIYIKANSEPTNITTTCREDAILIGSNAHKVTIDNIDITKFKNYGIRFSGKISSITHHTDRVLRRGDKIIIKNSRLNYLGITAIALRSQNEERSAKIVIANNEIDHVLATGIALYNTYGVTIHHNYIHEIGGEAYGDELLSRNSWGVGTAIQLDTTSKAHIYKNHLKNLGYIGINMTHWGGVPVGGRVIEYNFIENVVQSLNDGGAIYRFGGMDSDKQFGWDKILNNIVLNSNGYIGFSPKNTNYQGAGIYTDNKSNYVEIANNTIVKSAFGLYYHENKYINGHHNTLVDGKSSLFRIYEGNNNVETKFNNNIVVNSNKRKNIISYPGSGLSESDNNLYRTYQNTVFNGKTLDQWIATYGFDGNSQVLTNKTNKPTILINTTNNKLSFKHLDGCKNVDDSPIGDNATIGSYNSLVLFDCTNYNSGTYRKSK